MELDSIKKHWENWAQHGTSLLATTKTSTIKKLEIDAVSRAAERAGFDPGGAVSILEVGCGNGHNVVALAEKWTKGLFFGLDYIDDMIASARRLAEPLKARVKFDTGNVLELESHRALAAEYDVVFTDRLLINLNTVELQARGIAQLAKKVRKGGALILIENFRDTYDVQNGFRELLDTPARTPFEFNLFMHERDVLDAARASNLRLVDVDDFGSLHDLVLYVLIPAINGGTNDFDNPLVAAATQLSLRVNASRMNSFGSFGQNRLYLFQKN